MQKDNMNNQKDTPKTGLNSYGQGNVLDIKALDSKHIYEFVNKKTEKLVTALYMVTDCMDTDDALKIKLRELSVQLLSDMYKISNLSPMDKVVYISTSLAHVDEILSFIEIAYTIGFISEMNTAILKKEFSILIQELEIHQMKDKHFTFTLDEGMFSFPKNTANLDRNIQGERLESRGNNIKDKRTNFNTMSFINKKPNLSISEKPYIKNYPSSVSEKKDRTDKILSILSEKDISIKDISNSFTDCSEKTIQRELNALVLKGQIKKTGSKRWSRYSLITN